MKKASFTMLLAVTITAFAAIFNPGETYAQYLLDKTSYTPIYFPKITTEYLIDMDLGNNQKFTGTAYYSDGQITRYDGKVVFGDGAQTMCQWFTPNFQCPNDHEYLFVDPKHETAYRMRVVNGQPVQQQTYNVKGRSFYVQGARPVFADDGMSGGGNYNSGGGNYNSGSSSSSSSYDSHKADCRGCNTTGHCQRCGGSGKRTNTANGRLEDCSLCRGTGRCVSCGGKGYIRGNF